MTKILLSMGQILVFAASMYGWGQLAANWCYRGLLAGWAFPTTLGIAVSIALGGLLNAFHIAYTAVLGAMLIAGFGLAIYFFSRTLAPKHSFADKAAFFSFPAPARFSGVHLAGKILFFALLFCTLVFLVSALMPARNFNFHDDFHNYLMWPVRMLQVGSLGGNPFDHIGLSSLGAQAFMQGMFLTFVSKADVNAFDAILCMILTFGLLLELGERLGLNILFILAACILALFINPQYVNISSIYSGSLMLTGLAYATLILAEELASSEASSRTIMVAVPCSLFYAALLSLKTTYVFTAPLFWAASLACSLLLFKERTQALRAHLFSAVGTIVFLLPWLAVHLDRYILKIHYILDGVRYPGEKGFSASLLTKGNVLEKLFSTEELFWGNTYREYLFLFIMLCVALLIVCWVAWQGRERRDTCRILPILAALFSVVFTYPLYYKETFFMADRIVRYSCPLLIGAAPMAALLAGWLWSRTYESGRKKSRDIIIFIVLSCVLLIFQATLVGMFSGTFMERVKRADRYGTLLSFRAALAPRNVEYNQYALGGAGRQRMLRLQGLVPVGETILAWVSMPMYLDYRRNPIYPTYEYGLSNQLLIMPFTEGPEGMRRFFQQYGIRYFIWEYSGYGMKSQEQYGGIQRKFGRTLTDLLAAGRMLYNDGGTVVFDIGFKTKKIGKTEKNG